MKLSIIVPTLNRADLLLESFETLRGQPYQHLFIIDNGNQSLLDEAAGTLERATLIRPGRNLGVSASWNLGLTEALKDESITHVLSINDDIVLHPDQVWRVTELIERHLEKWFFVGESLWSVWSISRYGVEVMSIRPNEVFDPSFWPAYCEDNDFHYRLNLINPSKLLHNCPALTPMIYRNSMTHEKTPVINHERSERFYIKKWGGKPGHEVFTIPFNGQLTY